MADLSREFLDTIRKTDERKTKAFDSTGVVKRVKNGIAYVHLAGGVDETPVKMTMNAQAGDEVQVRVANGRAWLAGNVTAPPTDDAQARRAIQLGRQANDAAAKATKDAMVASAAADSAVKDAKTAKEAAEAVEGIAEQAGVDAQQANDAASSAIEGMSLVQRVVDVANWIAEHGTYILTTDTEPIEGKFYFIHNASTNTYSIVTPQEGDNPQLLGWYEMGSIDESVSNFISTHMVLLDDGLALQNGATRLYLDTGQNAGVRIENNGQQVAYYGDGAIIGDARQVHIQVTNSRLSFFDGQKEVAYVDGQKLYISQTVVLQQMDIGDSDLGVWTWYVHEVAGLNNLSLKWLG